MRKKRELIENAVYHVVARTNRKELRLESVIAKDLFLEVLVLAKKKFDYELFNFVLMNNHFHLLIRPVNCELPKLIGWIMSISAQAYNRVYKQIGRLWGGRYFSSPICSPEEYDAIYAYIDNNPVKAKLVEAPEDWEWSGAFHRFNGCTDLLGVRPPRTGYSPASTLTATQSAFRLLPEWQQEGFPHR